MMEIWIARDCDGTVAQFFDVAPVLRGDEYIPNDDGMRVGFRILPTESFPEVKPGECRKATITLEAP